MIPPRSSATASAARKILSPIGTLLSNIDSTPSENAMSVAIGMATPRIISGSLGQVTQKKSTGMSMPPQAPMIGSIAFLRDDSSPTRISLFISRPTDRKNIAMRKSLITSTSAIGWPLWLNRLKSPIERLTSLFQKLKNSPFSDEFARIRASTVLMMRTALLFTYFFTMLLKL